MRAMLSLLLLTVATPAAAQIWDGGRPAESSTPAPPPVVGTLDRDLRDIDRSIREGRRNNELTRREARSLRGESGMISLLARQYRDGGPIAVHAGHLEVMALSLRGMVEAQRARRRQ